MNAVSTALHFKTKLSSLLKWLKDEQADSVQRTRALFLLLPLKIPNQLVYVLANVIVSIDSVQSEGVSPTRLFTAIHSGQEPISLDCNSSH